jgi:hypothetical protein
VPEIADWVRLKIRSTSGFLCEHVDDCSSFIKGRIFCKKIQRLLAYQEGLRSMELISTSGVAFR